MAHSVNYSLDFKKFQSSSGSYERDQVSTNCRINCFVLSQLHNCDRCGDVYVTCLKALAPLTITENSETNLKGRQNAWMTDGLIESRLGLDRDR